MVMKKMQPKKNAMPKAPPPKGFGASGIHPNAHPGDGWNTHSRRHSAKSGKSGKFT